MVIKLFEEGGCSHPENVCKLCQVGHQHLAIAVGVGTPLQSQVGSQKKRLCNFKLREFCSQDLARQLYPSAEPCETAAQCVVGALAADGVGLVV